MPEAPAAEHAGRICRLHVAPGTVQQIGTLANGGRRVMPIVGGRVEGPHLQDGVLPGGADRQLVTPGGSAAIEARYTLSHVHHARERRAGARLANRRLVIAAAARDPAAVMIDLCELG